MNLQSALEIKEQAVNLFFPLLEQGIGAIVEIGGPLAEFALGIGVGAIEWAAENVVGFGLGVDAGAEWYVRVYVKTRVPAFVQSILGQIPFWTDLRVVESGAFQAIAAAAVLARTTPLRVGAVIGLNGVDLNGTLGAFVQDPQRRFLLTCAHVVDANVASPSVVEKPTGSPNLPAGSLVATAQFMSHSAPDGDWALAEVDVQFDPALPGRLGALQPQPVQPAIHIPVIRASGTNPRGTIYDPAADVVVDMLHDGILTFKKQIIIQGENHTLFADRGDSGSLAVMDGTSPRAAVGLVFAKNVHPKGAPANLNLNAAMPLVQFFHDHSLTFIV